MMSLLCEHKRHHPSQNIEFALYFCKKVSENLRMCNFCCTFAAIMRNLPRVTKNILLLNFIVYFIDVLLERYSGIYLTQWLGLWNTGIGAFHIWQPLTYMFMHANFGHIFCNMFAVLMFGPALEELWGERKFLIYYLVCGIGAALVQMGVWALFTPGEVAVTVGASGAVFGILLAFGWLFPDVKMFLLFVPIPIRARIFVIGYAVIELFAGIAGIDNVAHFAHLGGMLFGCMMILWWQYRDKWKFPHLGSNHDTKKEQDYDGYHYQPPIS